MLKAFPLEFRRDVVAVARKGGASIAQVAKDFGVSVSCLQRWLKLADVEDGTRPRATREESAELREAKRRVRAFGAEERGPASGCCLLRPVTSTQNDVPAGPRPGRRQHQAVRRAPGQHLRITTARSFRRRSQTTWLGPVSSGTGLDPRSRVVSDR
jgi:transposase